MRPAHSSGATPASGGTRARAFITGAISRSLASRAIRISWRSEAGIWATPPILERPKYRWAYWTSSDWVLRTSGIASMSLTGIEREVPRRCNWCVAYEGTPRNRQTSPGPELRSASPITSRFGGHTHPVLASTSRT